MHEGKNRVRYLRETCGASLMPALMSTLRFPGPDRLCLLTADAAPGPFYALMLDKRWLTLLQHPSLSLPLLRSYGIFPTAWPYHLPAIEELLGSCSWQAYAHGTPFALDVDAWQRRQRGQKERLHGDAFGLVDSSPHWPGVRRLAWSAAAIGVLGGVITALSGGHLAVFGAAALTATSVVTGALLALSTPLISAPRSVWAPGQGQSKSDGLE
ncbi:hypothetical protein [Rhodanobacter thiooxydans]|uniref:hypothetical protein n=1 Tax=Rhodanobacter thiooxydans TaxID=416169 RepID=UPI001F40A506|nr:hypothetical protein [Rhodanobacter thiooxydans]UJJ56690.1 hypothetical protein LRK53_18955 [Rhodanobacter thiooxydans]